MRYPQLDNATEWRAFLLNTELQIDYVLGIYLSILFKTSTDTACHTANSADLCTFLVSWSTIIANSSFDGPGAPFEWWGRWGAPPPVGKALAKLAELLAGKDAFC